MRTEVQCQHAELMQMYMTKANTDAFALYRALLAQGAPRELARTVLPVATYSKMFATVDLHNLARFLKLRLHSHAQFEIRVYAEAMLEIARTVCPVAISALEENWGLGQ